MKILGMVDKYLEQNDAEQLDSKVRTSHHPSGYSDCMRKMYYDWTKHPVSNYRTATDVYRMMIGKWIHNGFAEILKEMFGDKVNDEVEFHYADPDLEFPIHGYMDSVIEVGGKIIGVELKTSFGRGIVSIAKEGQPRREHEEQARIYLSINKQIHSFSIPYLGRDSFYRTEFELEMTEDHKEKFLKKVVEKFKRLEEYVKAKEIPRRDFSAVVKDGEIKDKIQHKTIEYKSDWQCLYCVYRDSCYSKEIEDMGIHLPEEVV